jgi:hypothetical protein
MKPAARESIYQTLSRLSGLALVLTSVFFQRRGLMDWTEFVFLGVCVGLQETFLRLPGLRRWRTPMLVAYSVAPLVLILAHAPTIRANAGDLVGLVLYTPLPLVLVSVQIMVLYVRDAQRLVSVVLVLALFSAVIGVRRPMDDAVWPWLAAVSALAAVFLALQHPGMLYHGVYTRRAHQPPPAARPGGILRRSFVSTLPLLAMSTVVASLFLYVAAPRVAFDRSEGDLLGRGEAAGNPGTGIPQPGMREPPGSRSPPGEPASVAGLGDGLDLGDFGEILKTDMPALEVKPLYPTQFAPPTLYLRAFTYAVFDGGRWQPLPDDGVRGVVVPEGSERRLSGAPAHDGYVVRAYEVTPLGPGMGRDGVAPLPVEAQAVREYGGPLLYDSVEHTLKAPALQPGESLVIEVQQAPGAQALGRRVRGAGPSRTPLPPEYRAITDDLREEIASRFQMFEELRRDAFALDTSKPPHQRGVFAVASRIVRMFQAARIGDSPAWSYSLDARPGPGWDAIARFLDTGPGGERVGHCEYFASAMCALLRCFGVPCRLAAGFAAKASDADGVWRVTTGNAHAWVEVYFDELGWVTFDPTPAANGAMPVPGEGPEDPAPDEQAPEPEEEPDAEPEAARDWFREFNRDDQRQLYHGAMTGAADAIAGADDALLAATAWMPGWIPRSGFVRVLVLALPFSVTALLLLLRGRRRRKIEKEVLQGMGATGKRRDRGLYFELLLLLAGFGYHKRPSETPREFARRVQARGGGAHQPVARLTELYYALRFGGNRELAGDFKRVLGEYADALKVSVQPPAGTDAETTPTP